MIARTRPVVVIGEFDGYHLGHRRLLRAAHTVADREHRPLVAVVLSDERNLARLAAVDDICRRLVVAGASATRVLQVDPRAEVAGPQVAAQVADLLEPALVVMACLPHSGHDPHYPDLRPQLAARGVELIEVERAVDGSDRAISSRMIRRALLVGEADSAARALGEPYSVRGEVVHGSGLGRTIGYPTANVWPPAGRLLPALGVYAGSVRLPGGSTHAAAINLGVRPTVERAGSVLIEAHLLDFDADLYGARIEVAFHDRLRGESRFASVDALIAQLHADVAAVRRLLR